MGEARGDGLTDTVVIVHKWGGDSESDWIPWLRAELESRGINVTVPDMPNTDAPKIEEWVPFLNEIVKEANENLYLVGHSMGCQAILRYMAALDKSKKIGGVAFVAGFVTIKWEALDNSGKEIMKPWVETPINWNAVNSHSAKFVCIYSDDDPYVPVDDASVFEQKLGAKTVLSPGRGHFSEKNDITQLPELLNELLVIMGLPVETTLI